MEFFSAPTLGRALWEQNTSRTRRCRNHPAGTPTPGNELTPATASRCVSGWQGEINLPGRGKRGKRCTRASPLQNLDYSNG